jgi:RNA polymerase sigma-70 factor (family 1)
MSAYLTDQEVISLVSAGNQNAFEILYKRYWADLYKLAFFILRNRDASKDIVQNVFVWVWEHKQDLEIQYPKSYLRAAVKFKIANLIRSGNIQERFFEEVSKYNYSTSIPGSEEVAELKELNNIIQRAISQLPFKCKEIFLLSREANLSNREVANQLGVSIKTVESQITIALHRIRTNIGHFID